MKPKSISETSKTSPSRFQGLQLLMVQSSVCVSAVLVMLLLRVVGVDVYTDLSARFQQAMTDRVLVSATQAATSPTNTTQPATADALSVTAVQASPVTFYAPLTGGVLTSSFGEREDPFGTGEVSVHQGMDIAAPEGTSLAALADGHVSEVGFEEDGYGHYLIVTCEHGNRYLYAHCSSISVTQGMAVTGGMPIANVGNTGRSTGSHVHIEWMREDGTREDPSAVVPRDAYA